MNDQPQEYQATDQAEAPAALPGQVNPLHAHAYGAARASQAGAPADEPGTSPEQSAPQAQQPTMQQSIPPVQNIYITQQVQQQAPSVVVAVAPKSMVLAIVLAAFFGPLGMLYSTVTGAVVMFLASIVVAAVTFGVGLIATWPICIVWAAVAASQANARSVAQAQSMTQISR